MQQISLPTIQITSLTYATYGFPDTKTNVTHIWKRNKATSVTGVRFRLNVSPAPDSLPDCKLSFSSDIPLNIVLGK